MMLNLIVQIENIITRIIPKSTLILGLVDLEATYVRERLVSTLRGNISTSNSWWNVPPTFIPLSCSNETPNPWISQCSRISSFIKS